MDLFKFINNSLWHGFLQQKRIDTRDPDSSFLSKSVTLVFPDDLTVKCWRKISYSFPICCLLFRPFFLPAHKLSEHTKHLRRFKLKKDLKNTLNFPPLSSYPYTIILHFFNFKKRKYLYAVHEWTISNCLIWHNQKEFCFFWHDQLKGGHCSSREVFSFVFEWLNLDFWICVKTFYVRFSQMANDNEVLTILFSPLFCLLFIAECVFISL